MALKEVDRTARTPDLRTAIEAAMHEWAVLPRWRRVELEREQQAQFVYRRLLAREWLVDIEQVREMIK